MKRKSQPQDKKSEESKHGTVQRPRLQMGANRSAVAPRAVLGQEGTLASALRTFRLDRHGSYTAQVEIALREAIVRGRLSPGTSLSEAAISTTLGISRTPVREALALLADEQLVVIYPQVKTLVAPVRRSLIDRADSAQHARMRQSRRTRENRHATAARHPRVIDCGAAQCGHRRRRGSLLQTR